MPEGENPRAAQAEPRLSDLLPAGGLQVVTIRSPSPRGRLLGVEAPHLPKGYLLIEARDLPGANRISCFGSELPILAEGRIAFSGEPVALLAGPDTAVLADIVAKVKVRVEEEEPLVNWESFSSEQVAAKRVASLGDPELAFSIADKVVERSYRAEALEHWYSEPQGALASFDYDKLEIRCATQWPYHVRDSVARALGTKPEDVVVRPTRLGAHLDGKLWYPSLLACHAALAAFLGKRSARLLLSREEDFLYSPKRAPEAVALRAALDKSGNLSALDVRMSIHVGAQAPLAEELLSQACLAVQGAYVCPNLRLEGYAVTTNSPPLGAFGGLGAAPAFLAIESLSTELAEAAGMDPIEWKSRNLLRKGSRLLAGDPLKEDTPFDAIAEQLCRASDFRRKWAAYELVRKRRSCRSEGPMRGIGLAFAHQTGVFLSGSGPNSYTVEACLDKDLRLLLKTSAAICKGGIADIWRQSAAEILGIPADKVSIAPPDTDGSPNSGPVTLSRGLSVVNRLVERACTAIQKRRFRDPLPISAKAIHRLPSSSAWEPNRVAGSPLESAAWGGAVVEVELDSWTLEPRTLGLWLCVEGGRIVSHARAASALRAAASAALSSCMRERLAFERGAISREAFLSYETLPLAEVPPILVEFLEAERRSPAKGLGELPFDTVPAAFLSAVSQAAGIHFTTLPLGPDALSALEDA